MMHLPLALDLTRICKLTAVKQGTDTCINRASLEKLDSVLGQDLLCVHEDSVLNFKLLLIKCHDYSIVVVGGTDSCVDWFYNLRVKLEQGVHSGYLAAARIISDKVEKFIDGEPHLIAGHSLGGAVASLLTYHCQDTNHRATYSFGSPKIADEYAAATIKRVTKNKIFNFQRSQDIVGKLPVLLHHVAPTLTLDPEGGINTESIKKNSILKLLSNPIEQHRIDRYTRDIAKAISKISASE